MSVMSDEDIYTLPFKLTLEQLNVNRLIVDDEYLELDFLLKTKNSHIRGKLGKFVSDENRK